MATPNFSSILDESPDEVSAPVPLPQGTYLCIVGMGTYGKSPKKGTDFVEFPLRPILAEDDVDKDELNEAGGLEGKVIKAIFYITPDAVFLLDHFHAHCGIDLTEDSSRKVRNDEVMNAEVRAFVKHEPSQDGTRIFARFNRSLPAE